MGMIICILWAPGSMVISLFLGLAIAGGKIQNQFKRQAEIDKKTFPLKYSKE